MNYRSPRMTEEQKRIILMSIPTDIQITRGELAIDMEQYSITKSQTRAYLAALVKQGYVEYSDTLNDGRTKLYIRVYRETGKSEIPVIYPVGYHSTKWRYWKVHHDNMPDCTKYGREYTDDVDKVTCTKCLEVLRFRTNLLGDRPRVEVFA